MASTFLRSSSTCVFGRPNAALSTRCGVGELSSPSRRARRPTWAMSSMAQHPADSMERSERLPRAEPAPGCCSAALLRTGRVAAPVRPQGALWRRGAAQFKLESRARCAQRPRSGRLGPFVRATCGLRTPPVPSSRAGRNAVVRGPAAGRARPWRHLAGSTGDPRQTVSAACPQLPPRGVAPDAPLAFYFCSAGASRHATHTRSPRAAAGPRVPLAHLSPAPPRAATEAFPALEQNCWLCAPLAAAAHSPLGPVAAARARRRLALPFPPGPARARRRWSGSTRPPARSRSAQLAAACARTHTRARACGARGRAH